MNTQNYTRVRHVMTPSPRVIDGLSTVREAIDLMREANISSLIIERRHGGDEYGMLSAQDIAAIVTLRDVVIRGTAAA